MFVFVLVEPGDKGSSSADNEPDNGDEGESFKVFLLLMHVAVEINLHFNNDYQYVYYITAEEIMIHHETIPCTIDTES